MKKRVADIIIDILCEKGISDCFLVVGGGAMHLDNALAKNEKINKICNHHEQACAMAAEAYARVSGRIAAVCVTSGPGATNAITGVMGAYQDSIPMIVLSGQVRYEISSMKTDLPLRYRGIQEYDIVPAVKNMTKYAKMITDPLSIKCEVEKAIDIAMSGRRGPVWLDIPLDVQSAVVETDNLYENQYRLDMVSTSESELEQLIGILYEAKRPCILGGTGIVSSNLQHEFIEIVEKLHIPVIGGGWCTDMMHTDHPLYYGLSGDIGPRTGNFIVQNADVILVLGNSLSYRQTGYAQDKFAPKAKIIWVDVDQYESMKPGMHPYLFINSDLKDFFAKMKMLEFDLPQYKEWFEYCDMLKNRFTPYESIKQGVDEQARVNSYYFWKKFDKYAKEDSIIAMGNSRGNAAKIQIGVKRKGQRAITNYLCGSMGYDLPAAIGSAVASKKEVLCITGDGSIMMNLQELQTVKQNKLPIKVVVFSNEGYEAIRQTCKNFFGGVYLGCTKESGVSFPDFKKVAEAFDFTYDVCENNGQLDEKLQKLFSSKGNLFLEIKQQLENPLIPKVMSRMRADGTFETPALHDMAPFLSEDELRLLMIGE